MTQVPGQQITQAVISDQCREGHGNEGLGAFDEACRQLREQYADTLAARVKNNCADQCDYVLTLSIDDHRRRDDD